MRFMEVLSVPLAEGHVISSRLLHPIPTTATGRALGIPRLTGAFLASFVSITTDSAAVDEGQGLSESRREVGALIA